MVSLLIVCLGGVPLSSRGSRCLIYGAALLSVFSHVAAGQTIALRGWLAVAISIPNTLNCSRIIWDAEYIAIIVILTWFR